MPWKDAGVVVYDGVSTEVTFIHEVLPNFISKRKIMYRIQAINEIGAGPFSEPNEVKTVNRHWSKAHSWPGKVAPVAGSDIVIPYGQNWTFDLTNSPVYGKIEVSG